MDVPISGPSEDLDTLHTTPFTQGTSLRQARPRPILAMSPGNPEEKPDKVKAATNTHQTKIKTKKQKAPRDSTRISISNENKLRLNLRPIEKVFRLNTQPDVKVIRLTLRPIENNVRLTLPTVPVASWQCLVAIESKPVRVARKIRRKYYKNSGSLHP